MSFQRSAYSWRARLHVGKAGPAVVAGVLAAGALVAACAGFGLLHAGSASGFEVSKGTADPPAAQESAASSVEEATPAEICVHVSGCVAEPGVRYLSEGARVAEAVEAAGGLSANADGDAVNLARVLVDGEQVYVPSVEEAAAAAPAGGGSGGAAAATGRVNINTADAALLQTLDGVGEATALKIVKDREANGPFQTIEDLKRVSGIGDKKFEGLKDSICV